MKDITKVASFMIIAVMVMTCAVTSTADGNDATTSNWSEDADTDWYNDTESTFTLTTPQELAGLAELVNNNNNFENKTINLVAGNSYDISNYEWTPIGTGTRDGSGITENSNTFNGIFNGNSAIIDGLTITSPSNNADDAIGFFGIVSEGTVAGLKFTDVNINVINSEMAGVVIGMMINNAIVQDCTVGSDSSEDTSSITASRGNGGIVGRMTISGTIEKCTNYADINATGTGGNTGGIVGAAYYTGTGQAMTISDCHNYGTIESAGMGVGGIVGLSAANISGCSNNASVSGTGTSIGGIVGEQKNYGTLTNCINSGDVTNGSSTPGVSDDKPGGMGTGGIVGWIRYSGNNSQYPLSSTVVIKNCDNSGDIKTESTHSGGIVGAVYHSIEMTLCDNTGSVTGQNFTGGLIGGMQTVDEFHPDDGCRLLMVENTTSGAVSGGSQSGGALGHFPSVIDSNNETCKIKNGSNWTVYNNTVRGESNTGNISLDSVESVTVVEIDGIIFGYNTIQNAVDNSPSGSTITIIYDCTGCIEIPSGKSITLDLNGHKIVNSDNDHTIYNKGTLVIIDSVGTGVVDNITHLRASVYNEVGGTVTLDGGKYTRSLENGSSSVNDGDNSFYNILNHGTMTINDGVVIEQNGQFSSLVENGWQDGNDNTKQQTSVMIINGGEFTGGLNTIKNDDYGQLTINGGIFKNVAQSAVLNWNIAVINGGEFTGESDTIGVILNGFLNNSTDKGELTINGGTYNGNITLQKMGGSTNMGSIDINGGTFNAKSEIIDTVTDSNAKITVSGGEFSSEVPSQYLAEDFDEMAQNDDGMYIPSVSGDDAVASIGSAKYPSLDLAFRLAYSLDSDEPVIIKLLKNFESTGVSVEEGSNIILDFNGFTLTSTGGAGSAGTETQAFQLLKNSTIVFKNGTLNGKGPNCHMLIQNYSNLTLDNMILNANENIKYAISNNNGSLTIDGGTIINASEGNKAFDIYYWPDGGYPDGVDVLIIDGTINGDIEYATDGTEESSDYKDKISLSIENVMMNGSILVGNNIDDPNITISGGIFTEDVTDYLSDGFVLKDNGDGTYGAIPGSDANIKSPGDNGSISTTGSSIVITSNGQDDATITVIFTDYDATLVLSGSFAIGSHTVTFNPMTGTDVLYDYAYGIETPSITVSSITVTVPIDVPEGFLYSSSQVWHYDGDDVSLLPDPTFDATTSELTFVTPYNSTYQIDVVFDTIETGPDIPPISDDDYVPPIYIPSQTTDNDDTVKIVACAAAAVVAAIMAAFLILGHRKD